MESLKWKIYEKMDEFQELSEKTIENDTELHGYMKYGGFILIGKHWPWMGRQISHILSNI